jgi:hypothetical protein
MTWRMSSPKALLPENKTPVPTGGVPKDVALYNAAALAVMRLVSRSTT